jgi:hypothetical protein
LYLLKSALGIDLFPNHSLGIWSWFKSSFWVYLKAWLIKLLKKTITKKRYYHESGNLLGTLKS